MTDKRHTDEDLIDIRDRLTERVNRARLKLEIKRSLTPFVIVCLGIVLGIACLTWEVRNVSKAGPLSNTRTLKFAVDDASGVIPGRDPLRFKGIPAGQITGLDMSGQEPVVTVKMQNSFGPIYRNAKAELLPDTPLEDMHLDIISRGDRSAGLAGENQPIAASQTQSQVQVGQVLDVFQPNVQLHFREMLNNLGNGLQDRGASLRTAFAELMPLLETADRIAAQLSVRKTEVRQLIHNSAELTSELGDRQQMIRTLLRQGSAAFGTLEANRGNLGATLAELPPTLQQADSSLTALNGILGQVDTAVTRLRPVAAVLPNGLSAVRALSSRLTPAATRLEPAVHSLLPLSGSLPPLSAALRKAMITLQPQVPVIDRATQDTVKCQQGISKFFLWQPTTGVFDDIRGTMLRADVQLSALANGVINTPRRYANTACAGPLTLGGKVAEPKDER